MLIPVATLLFRAFPVVAYMEHLLPPTPHWLVDGLIETNPLPASLVSKLADRFPITEVGRITLGSEEHVEQNPHDLLFHLSMNNISIPGLEWFVFLEVKQDGAVHTIHLLFSIPVSAYSFTRRLFDTDGKILDSRPHLVLCLLVEAFTVQRTTSAAPMDVHSNHLGGVTNQKWWTQSCERGAKLE